MRGSTSISSTPALAQRGEGGVDVGDPVGDVVKALAALLQEPADGRLRRRAGAAARRGRRPRRAAPPPRPASRPSRGARAASRRSPRRARSRRRGLRPRRRRGRSRRTSAASLVASRRRARLRARDRRAAPPASASAAGLATVLRGLVGRVVAGLPRELLRRARRRCASVAVADASAVDLVALDHLVGEQALGDLVEQVAVVGQQPVGAAVGVLGDLLAPPRRGSGASPRRRSGRRPGPGGSGSSFPCRTRRPSSARSRSPA